MDNKLLGLYHGTVEVVYAPNNQYNRSQYQYEYDINVVGELTSVLSCRCVILDPYGDYDRFLDSVYSVGDRVFIMFPGGNRTTGIIMGGTRNYGEPIDPSLGVHWHRRFNQIQELNGQDGTYSITSDFGPFLSVGPELIALDDGSGDQILIDKAAKTITINCGTWKVQVGGDATVNIAGAANITAQSANINIQKDAQVTTGGDLKAQVGGDATVTASGDASINGLNVNLNKQEGGLVVTTITHPFDYCTGIPISGVPTVKAG